MPEVLGRTGRGPRSLHALTWAWWALAAVATIQLAPNPTYVALVVGIAALAVETHAGEGGLARAFPLLVWVAVLFVGVRIVLAAATTHPPPPGVLFHLPDATLPAILGGFTVGGAVHAHVVLRAAADGFVIVGMVAAFGAFNAVVSHYELVRAAPRAFHELGVVVTVALAFVPSTISAIAAVREADRARTGGRVVRRGRFLRLLLPVLESGLERAMSLAESMDARGFGHRDPDRIERGAAWLGLLALVALGGTFVALVARARTVALVVGTAGALLLVVAVVTASRAQTRPRHRPRRLGRADLVTAAVVAVAPISVAVLAAGNEPSLVWPLEVQRFPTFDPVVGLAVLALAAPALRRPQVAAEARP